MIACATQRAMISPSVTCYGARFGPLGQELGHLGQPIASTVLT